LSGVVAAAGAVALAAGALAGCGTGAVQARPGTVLAVGAENQYANVIEQVGGRYVTVTAVESNPNTDPHSFEASPSIAGTVAAAQLVVQNGVGYDSYMGKIEAASPSTSRTVIEVQKLLGLPASTANPHLWYDPSTMPVVAAAVAGALARLAPEHAAYFHAKARAFDTSLDPLYAELAAFRRRFAGTPVATTEPVGDDLLAAAGTVNRTPSNLQADIMNGVDPAPQDVGIQEALLVHRGVRALVYNQQVTDPLTESFLAAAKRAGVPVVGAYETMPTPGYDYQSWMLAEVRALRAAVAEGKSTQSL
jgi:zinc/manganese transport system substrate-binding protein